MTQCVCVCVCVLGGGGGGGAQIMSGFGGSVLALEECHESVSLL